VLALVASTFLATMCTAPRSSSPPPSPNPTNVAANPDDHASSPPATPKAWESIRPGSPIEHVVFIVKENRTFNNYFATYPGATGATEGGTITCDSDACQDGPVVPLKRAKDVQPHDLTHCFR
jgi:phospholipase C